MEQETNNMNNITKLKIKHLIQNLDRNKKNFCISCKEQNISSIVMEGMFYMKNNEELLKLFKEYNNELNDTLN